MDDAGNVGDADDASDVDDADDTIITFVVDPELAAEFEDIVVGPRLLLVMEVTEVRLLLKLTLMGNVPRLVLVLIPGTVLYDNDEAILGVTKARNPTFLSGRSC